MRVASVALELSTIEERRQDQVVSARMLHTF
jgi:hypothetical protein